MTAERLIEQPQRISLREAAALLDTSVWSLRRWAKAGVITHYLVGAGNYMEFDPRDIEALRESWRRPARLPVTE
jgi:DNA-binding transcriptional MerR regulator